MHGLCVLTWVNLCSVIYLDVVSPFRDRYRWSSSVPSALRAPHAVTVPYSLHVPLMQELFSR